MKEREQLFSDYLTELKKRSKQKDSGQKQSTKSKAEKVRESNGVTSGLPQVLYCTYSVLYSH